MGKISKIQEIRDRDEFKEKAEKIEQADKLEDLFELWYDAQKEEANPEETLPHCFDGKIYGDDIELLKENFCKDGVTSIEGHVSQSDLKVKVLFILKESNIKGKVVERSDIFWFNDVQKNEESYKTRGKYAKNLMNVLKVFDSNASDEEKFGYMNLNKRGGFGSNSYKYLTQYVAKYRRFIKRQIELYDPEKIVFCGCYDNIANLLFDGVNPKCGKSPVQAKINGKYVTLYYVYHPSCAVSRFDKSLRSFKK